jgi:hypothetical protein
MMLTVNFCGTCGSTLWKTGSIEPLQGLLIVEIGTLDDLAEIDKVKPEGELYATYRAKWLDPIPGATQM